jgi:hypothetical protein
MKYFNFLAEAGASKLKAQGAALTLKKLADDASWAEMTKGGYTLKRFEGNIPDIETDHELDVLFEKVENGVTKKRIIEMKNWSVARSITGTTYDQFKQYITSGNEFIYYFSDAARGGMKDKFKSLFTEKANELIGLNNGNNYFTKLGYKNATQLIAGAKNIENNPLYNFIK